MVRPLYPPPLPAVIWNPSFPRSYDHTWAPLHQLKLLLWRTCSTPWLIRSWRHTPSPGEKIWICIRNNKLSLCFDPNILWWQEKHSKNIHWNSQSNVLLIRYNQMNSSSKLFLTPRKSSFRGKKSKTWIWISYIHSHLKSQKLSQFTIVFEVKLCLHSQSLDL